MLLTISATEFLVVQGGDVSYAYLFGDMDVPIVMEQPTDSAGILEKPGHVCLVQGSMYGTRQSGKIWGSIIVQKLISWKFKQSVIDQRIFYKKVGDKFFIIATVVDDMKFTANSPELLEYLKSKLNAKFDMKFFGKLTSFIGWEFTQHEEGIKISQRGYV